MRIFLKVSVLLLLLVVMTGCMPGTASVAEMGPSGILLGIWHGWIAPFSLIGHLFFDPAIRIYEVNNTGIWYDFGFYVAVISGFGGISFFRKKGK